MTPRPLYCAEDFEHSPFVAFYELTRACDLVCAHCRACAQPQRHPHELSTDQSRGLIKTTEAHHYRRFVLQHGGDWPHGAPGRAPIGVNDGRGVMFVSHTGQIFPSGFLPLECGRFPRDSIVDVYQRHPTFRLLRSPDKLKGKCGVCEYRHVCGGSRARAYALTRDPMAAEPDCVYEPEGWRREAVPC